MSEELRDVYLSFTRSCRPLSCTGNNPSRKKTLNRMQGAGPMYSVGDMKVSLGRVQQLFVDAANRQHRIIEKMRVCLDREGPEETLLRILDWLNVYADNTNAMGLRCICETKAAVPRIPKLYLSREFYEKPVHDIIVDVHGEECVEEEYGLLTAQIAVYGEDFMEEFATDLGKVRTFTPDEVYLACMKGEAVTECQKGEWSDAWERFV